MFERFTDRARRVVVMAQEEARRLNHNYIGTEHLLLGLLHPAVGGLAERALGELNVTLEAVREEVSSIIGSGLQTPSGHIPFSPRAKKVLELSLREALHLGADYIGTEHLLLGLLREGDGVAAQVLVRLGRSLDEVRETVITLYEQQLPEEREGRATVQPTRYLEREGRAAEPLRGRDEPASLFEPRVPGEPVRGREEPASLFEPRFPMPGFLQRRGFGRGSGAAAAREYAAATAPRTPVRSTDPVVPRPEESERLLAALARRERNNVLLVGPSGCGKSALVRGLAQTLATNRGPAALGSAEVVALDLAALRLGAERSVRRSVSPVVLVEDLDMLLRADDLSGGRLVTVLASLADAEIPLVVTGTVEAGEVFGRSFPSLATRFEVIELAEADESLTKSVLAELRPTLQDFHKVAIDDSALVAALEIGMRTVGGRVLPGVAVDLLDAAAARAAARKETALDGEQLRGAA